MAKKLLIFLVIVLAAVAFIFMKDANAPSEGEEIAPAIEETADTETGTGENVPTSETRPATETPAAAGTGQQTATVSYGPNGFTPNTVTIKLGGSVTFVNESESGMWVASSKHPTHTDYPEKTPADCIGSAFDQCDAVATGGSYLFIFNQKGTWGYHNHVSPNAWGKVMVE